MSFGNNLKEIRDRRGMTQEQLAHAIGLKTKAAISKIEKDITNPNQSTISKLAIALDVSPLEFFDFYKEEQEQKRLEPFREYLPFLAKAEDKVIDIVRLALGMEPLQREKKSGSSGEKAIS